MAVTLVNSSYDVGATGTGIPATVAGNTMVVAIALQGNTFGSPAAVTGVYLDGVDPGFVQLVSINQNFQHFGIWAYTGIGAGKTAVNIGTTDSGGAGALFAYEFSGVTTVLAATNATTGVSTGWSTGTVGGTGDRGYVSLVANRGAQSTSGAYGSGWTNKFTTFGSYAAYSAYAYGALGSLNFSGAWGSSTQWGGVAVSLAASSASLSGSETGAATDAASLIEFKQAAETGVATDAASWQFVSGTLSNADSGAAADAATLQRIYDLYPAAELGSGVDAATVLNLTPCIFRPPSIEGPRDRSHPLWRRIPHPVGVAVLKTGGLYRQVRNVGSDDIASASEVYLGGHEYIITHVTADLLSTAGYGEFIEELI